MRAALQEAKLIAEKSMIGRLHNQLADMNFRKLRWEEDLDATAAQLAAAQAQARAQKLQACLSYCFHQAPVPKGGPWTPRLRSLHPHCACLGRS